MASPAFIVQFEDVALAANTAKTVVAVLAATNRVLTLTEIVLSFDGVTAANVPVLCELVKGDGTAAGTSSAFTPVQVRGRAATAGSTAATTYTVEPTNLTVLKPIRIPPTSGTWVQLPLGREVEGDGTTNKLLGLRVKAGAIVNVTGWLEFEE